MNWRPFGLGVGVTLGVFLALAVVLVATFGLPTQLFFTPTESSGAAGLAADDAEAEVLAEDLDVPWEVVVLDEGRYLVPERPGTLVLVEDGEQHVVEEFDELEDPFLGEGGLLGVAVHPNFEETNWIYVYQTVDRESVQNTVRRFELDTESYDLHDETVIIDGIPSDRIHNGGRITFGPDGYLYITTGDSNDPDLAQDRDSLAGKILRLNDDGSIPADNPFDNPVYSYGHRNPQGLAWEDGRLWATEHGSSARDELNVIDAGVNYGWPTITGTQNGSGMELPVFTSGRHETWAPAGVAAHEDSVFFAGLRGERLYEATVDGESVVSFVAHFAGDFGRIRAVTLGPDGEYLYLTTSNTDGRGVERDGDDRLIRIPLAAFE
jgi:glucose/arabinose dehydrogenase